MPAMRLAELLTTYRPESWGGTRGDTWPDHAHYLWHLDPDHAPDYMHNLTAYMRDLGGWFGGPVPVDDGVVQDGHHRITAAAHLGWHHLPIPVQA